MESMNHSDNQGQEPQLPMPRKKTPADLMASFSVISGVAGALFCVSPLVQLPLGSAAVTLSLLARQQGKRGVQTAVGMTTGIIAIVLSIIIFASMVYVYQVVLNDPVLGPLYNDMYQQIVGSLSQAAAMQP